MACLEGWYVIVQVHL